MTPASPLRTPSLDAIELVATPVASLDAAPTLEVAGDAGGRPPLEVALVGTRLELVAPVSVIGDRWHASIPLRASRWGGPSLAPPSGSYRLEFRHAAPGAGAGPAAALSVHAALSVSPALLLPAPVVVPGNFRLALGLTPTGEVAAVFSAPLLDSERGPEAQARLEAEYRRARPRPLDAVFFESFYGQNASCNPLAIDRELAATRPDILRYWSVTDASVEVPPGAIALIDGSEEWWRIRSAARLLVVNDWLRRRFRRRAHQTVLQTWHGTPLKRIALTRPGLRARAAAATLLERFRWDILLSQNPYSTRIFRTAYAFLGKPWEEGYPRNDVLRGEQGAARGEQLRRTLGIAPEATVVLYAPTWRDDRPEVVDQLDVSAFSHELGDEFVTLLRGHSRSLRGGSDIHASNVIDVTSYPDASDLFLIADALVTDYSSVMFDFTVTGKPIYFFTPDLARYRDELRGFYFDLLAVSPGPVVDSAAELVDNLRNPERSAAAYAARYTAWTRRFNPFDDGHAAERVVRRLYARRAIG